MIMSNAKKRIIAVLSALSIVITLFPHNTVLKSVAAGNNAPSSADIGAIGKIIDDNFPLADNPSDLDGTHVWRDVKAKELPENVIIADFYYDEAAENSEPMYKLDAASGYTWPEKYKNYRWIEAKSVLILNGNGETYLYDDLGETAGDFELPEYGKRSIFAKSSLQGEVEYQWQIRYDIAKELWADIANANSTQLNVNYGLIASLLDEYNSVSVRCRSSVGEKISYSDAITVTSVPYTSESGTAAAKASAEAEKSASGSKKVRAYSARSGANALDAGSASVIHNIVINYINEDGSIAAPSFTAKIAEGSAFNQTVDFPTIVGYLPYIGDKVTKSYRFDEASVNRDITITVTYKPDDVNYTVLHYKQNLDNDLYSLALTETKKAKTGSTIPQCEKEYEGFYHLLYDTATVAADGSTVIEIYYDRYYYLLNFDMDGGYGTEPIYARYGTEISNVADPQKTGYTFMGWAETKGETDASKAVELPKTVPAIADGTKTYYAIWKVVDSAKVTVVFWGENPDDEGYSYLADNTKVINWEPGSKFTYSEGDMLICKKTVHTHTESCLGCGKSEHTHSAVGGACYTLTCTAENHTHGTGCYAGVGDQQNVYTVLPDNPKEGQIHNHWLYGSIIYIKGSWYKYTGSVASGSVAPLTCGKEESTHTHDDSCYGFTCTAEAHIHNSTCYSCGIAAHTHGSDCYMQGAGLDTTKWKFVKSDTITVAADGSSVVNVYYDRVEYSVRFYNGSGNSEYTDIKITAKWGAYIGDKWPTKNNSGTWAVNKSSNNDVSGPYQVYLQQMPVGGDDFYGPKTDSGTQSAYYYVEVLEGETGTEAYDGKSYKLHHTDTSPGSGYVVTDDDKYAIAGFTYNNFAANRNNSGNYHYNNAKFYYTRNSYKLTFNDGYKDVEQETVKFEAPLSTYKDYKPAVPDEYEPNSVVFDGWYQNPQCTGEEYKLEDHKMPANDLILYAKWKPVQHRVVFYLTEESEDIYSPDISTPPADFMVDHGAFIAKEYVDEHLDKISMNKAKPLGEYNFVFWYYYDEGGVKRPFDPSTSIRQNLTLYGEWSSNILKKYTVKYVLASNNAIRVADDTVGSGLAGSTKTFDAKGGAELYSDYQAGYFPTLRSKSVILDIEKAEITVVFEYVTASGPYTVKYLNKDTGESLADDKYVSDNTAAVVTETFKQINGYMPDAYQKRLVIQAAAEDNVIIFYYTADVKHAYYKVTHYIEDENGAWSEYTSSQISGDIGKRYTSEPLSIQGFEYKEIEYVVDSTKVTDITADGAELTAKGLEINLYYVRRNYPYQVRYLEQGTGKQLAEPKNGNGKYGTTVTENAIDITDYDKVAPTTATITVRIEEGTTPKLNIITFYYTEEIVQINYVVAAGEGTLSLESEAVKLKTGSPSGSAPTAADGYEFVGWYTDAGCTTAVNSDWVNSSTGKIAPATPDAPVTYYAKFVATDTSLTIKKSFPEDADYSIDENQKFVFSIVGKAGTSTADINLTVTVKGNSEIKLNGLPIGDYTVTEQTNWSWRYEPENGTSSKAVTISSASANSVEFVNERKEDKWLGGDASSVNIFNAASK